MVYALFQLMQCDGVGEKLDHEKTPSNSTSYCIVASSLQRIAGRQSTLRSSNPTRLRHCD
jgi:hypothetical protein